jgi:MoaA/NifB/PqqE/SkfB family radical SAM enzyme
MCYTWNHPSKKEEEIRPKDLETLPQMVRLNITGGEPFLREDLSDILSVVKKKAKRVVISSNGLLTQKTLEVMAKHPDIGIRISLEGGEETNERVRGIKGGYTRSLETLKGLKALGIKDLGIAVTVSDENADELVSLYNLTKENCVELATAILHNAYYFHKEDNVILDKSRVELGLRDLIKEYLKSPNPKNWFRAYFTQGIIDHMYGRKRTMKCTMATDSFYVDPYGFVRPCNVMNLPFGNVKEKSFEEIWKSPEAEEARKRVDICDRNCWMIGSVGHLMRHKWWVPGIWIVRNKWMKR